VNQVTRSTTQVIGAVPRRLTLSYQSLQAVAVGLDACALLISGVLGFALY
jgi:hypothetical protein